MAQVSGEANQRAEMWSLKMGKCRFRGEVWVQMARAVKNVGLSGAAVELGFGDGVMGLDSVGRGTNADGLEGG
jgi:hypothetical protein